MPSAHVHESPVRRYRRQTGPLRAIPALAQTRFEQGLDRVEDVCHRHRPGFARDHIIRDQVAREIDDDGGMFAVGKLHPRDAVCRGTHPERHSRTATAGIAVTRGAPTSSMRPASISSEGHALSRTPD